jgi:uncharacterized membrane protein
MTNSFRKKHYTFIVSMLAGLSLLLGIVRIFDIPTEQLFATLLPIITMVLVLIAIAFFLGFLLSWLRRKRD